LEKYNKILNSNLGKLYVLYSDVKTLADVVGNNNTSPYTNKAIADFSARLSSYDNTNDALVADLRKATQTKDKGKVLSRLRHAEDQLFKKLNSRTLTGGFVYIPFSAK